MGKVTRAPNGGWGWVIMWVSFLIHGLNAGTMFSFGVLYVSWLEEFQEGKATTSWVISVAVAFMYGAGPVPAAFASRFGLRATAIVGGLMTCMGFIASSFATSFPILMLNTGVLSGWGLGFCYLPSVTSVAIYFTTKRSFAMGIATSGVGIGCFIMAPFLNWLTNQYGWRGAMLILGAISLHLCAVAILIRPLELKDDDDDSDNLKNLENVCQVNEETDVLAVHCDIQLMPNSGPDVNGDVVATATDRGEVDIISNQIIVISDLPEHTNVETVNENDEGRIISFSEKLLTDVTPSNKSVSGTLHTQRYLLKGLQQSNDGGGSMQLIRKENVDENNPQFSSLQELRRKNVPLINNVLTKTISNQMTHFGSMYSMTFVYPKRSYLCEEEKKSVQYDKKDKLDTSTEETSKIRSFLRQSLKMMKNWQFVLFSISNFFTALAFISPNLHLVDRALENGIDKATGAIFISMNGAGSVFGRILFGYISDKPNVDRFTCYCLNLVVGGICTSLSPLCYSVVVLHGMYAFSFGCCMGCYSCLVPLVTVDMMGLQNVAAAFGLALVFMGFGNVIGPPLSGWVYNVNMTYTVPYVMNGLFLALSGVMLIPVWCVRRRGLSKDSCMKCCEART